MALSWQVVVDCADAPTLAGFWAAALGYEIEDQSRLIAQLLEAGQVTAEAVVEHEGRTYFRGLTAIREPDAPVNPLTGAGQGRRILFQEVPEPKTVKNRVHVDIHHEGSLETQLERLEGLGATRVKEVDQGPAGHWWIMCDPEGNEFCAA